jgi:sigma-E factor negative regulatory protein RseA
MVMNEQLSRLMDGDLTDGEAERVVAECARPELIACWNRYHLIGDALREKHTAAIDVSRRVAQALAGEPTVLAPRRAIQRPLGTWAFAAAAGVAAVTVVGWTALSLTETPGTAIAKAREAGAITAAQVRPQVLPQDYVLVHQEYSPATALQGVRPYLRAVSAQPADAR